MARAWQLHGYDGPQALRLEEIAPDCPRATEVRIGVLYFALNWGDLDLMSNRYSFSFRTLPARFGMEAMGIIEEVGADVKGFSIGDRVCTLPHFYGENGASTDTLVIDSTYVSHAPEQLSSPQSCALWLQYLTAYYPLARIKPVGAGENVLITAATSTAGTAALEIGSRLGANMIGTSRSAQNRDYLLAHGASEVLITPDKTNLVQDLLKASEGKGVASVMDATGNMLIAGYADALALNARIFYYGKVDGHFPTLPYQALLRRNVVFHPYSVFHYIEDPIEREHGLDFIREEVAAGRCRPEIDRIYVMEDLPAAIAYLRSERTAHGKVLIRTGKEE